MIRVCLFADGVLVDETLVSDESTAWDWFREQASTDPAYSATVEDVDTGETLHDWHN